MEEGQKARIIKRYTNRKLYDTEESRYVTLEEIAGLVKAGEEVQIVDNRTGKDLTEVTLAQILYEEQKKQTTRMPLNLLKEIIRTRGATISDFLQRAVTQPVVSLKEEAERKVDEIVRRSETTMEEKTRQVRDFFTNTQKVLDDMRKNLDDRLHTIVGAFGSRAQMREQLAELRKRIEELEARLK
ncbi:polyhydroxyalkanoate synthesis regulator DNA-binding domain-containing protein [Myxococcota bacterium]